MNAIKKIIADMLWRVGVGPLVRFFVEPKCVALCYHSIWDEQNSDELGQKNYAHISVHKDSFIRQLEYMQSRGYRFVHFSELTKKSSDKRVAVYFDDGFCDVVHNAYPILKEKHIPATLFLTTDYIDQKNYLSWQEIQSMADIFEFGSHSATHPKLNKISEEDARVEMQRSKEIIEEKLGTKVTAFSYPKGRVNADLERVARDVGYVITTADACFTKVRPDPDDSLSVFKWKALGI